MMKRTLCFISLLAQGFFAGCASTTVNDNGLRVMNEAAYEDTVDKNTDRIEKYDGLSNTVTVQATVLNSNMIDAELEQSARLYEWDSNKMVTERKSAQDKAAQQTNVFVSFYSPERKWDDLHKNKTLWKIFLDVNGQRYEGKAEKVKLLTKEVQSMYHYHTRFATPYMLSFPVSTSAIDGKPVRLVMTGSVDSVTLNFQGQTGAVSF